MNCPVCDGTLEKSSRDEKLTVKECNKCGGEFIPSYQYYTWIQVEQKPLPALKVETPVQSPHDSAPGKICPECGGIMTRHKIGRGLEFHVDRCGQCAGIWLDQGEWELLKEKDFHDKIHYIFSSVWKGELREQEIVLDKEEATRARLGEENYQKVKDFKDWYDTQTEKSLIMAYLNNK